MLWRQTRGIPSDPVSLGVLTRLKNSVFFLKCAWKALSLFYREAALSSCLPLYSTMYCRPCHMGFHYCPFDAPADIIAGLVHLLSRSHGLPATALWAVALRAMHFLMKPVTEVVISSTLSAESRNIFQSALAKQFCGKASSSVDISFNGTCHWYFLF